jgi:hypothetical protein
MGVIIGILVLILICCAGCIFGICRYVKNRKAAKKASPIDQAIYANQAGAPAYAMKEEQAVGPVTPAAYSAPQQVYGPPSVPSVADSSVGMPSNAPYPSNQTAYAPPAAYPTTNATYALPTTYPSNPQADTYYRSTGADAPLTNSGAETAPYPSNSARSGADTASHRMNGPDAPLSNAGPELPPKQ